MGTPAVLNDGVSSAATGNVLQQLLVNTVDWLGYRALGRTIKLGQSAADGSSTMAANFIKSVVTSVRWLGGQLCPVH